MAEGVSEKWQDQHTEKILTMTTWGESLRCGSVGVVVDGCPAGLALCEEDVQFRDQTGSLLTKRSESDAGGDPVRRF